MMKRASWTDYQKQIADDRYYYGRSCIRQNFFPGSEKAFIDILQRDLDRDLLDEAYFGCHPCINTSSLKFTTEDLMQKIIPALEHEPVTVTLPVPE